MLIGRQWSCVSCGVTIVLTPEQQRQYQAGQLGDWCADCSKALGAVRQELGLPEHLGVGFDDIRQFLKSASLPIVNRQRTFWDWLQGVDPNAQQYEYKRWANQQAAELTQTRAQQVRRLTEMANAAREFQATKMDAQLDPVRKRVELLRLKAEEAELIDSITERQALQEQRLKTLRLEESGKQVKLLSGLRAPEPEKTPGRVVAEHRKYVKTKSRAKQAVVSDFVKEIRRLHRTRLNGVEKAIRMRAVMEAYSRDEDDLPREIREFLRDVDGWEDQDDE